MKLALAIFEHDVEGVFRYSRAFHSTSVLCQYVHEKKLQLPAAFKKRARLRQIRAGVQKGVAQIGRSSRLTDRRQVGPDVAACAGNSVAIGAPTRVIQMLSGDWIACDLPFVFPRERE